MRSDRASQLAFAAVACAVFSTALLGGGRSKAVAAPGEAASTRHFHAPVELQSFAPIRTVGNEASGEPTIEVAADGSIYVAGTYGVGAASPVWRSRDGSTFAELETPAHAREYTVGAEGDLAVDDDGHVYFADTALAGVILTRWSDGGDTWDFTIPIAPGGPAVFDRPWLAWTERGLFLYVNLGSSIEIYRSEDEGLTWSPVGPLTWRGGSAGQPYFPGHMSAHRKTGALVAAGLIRDFGRGEVFLAATYSADAGETWREALVAPWPARPGGGISPIFPGMTAMDARGTAYVTWSEFDVRGCDVFYSFTSDEGRSWSEPVRLSRGRGCATFPTLDAHGDGRLAAAWYASPPSAGEGSDGGGDAPGDYAGRYGGFALPVAAYQDEVPRDTRWFVETASVTGAGSRRPLIARARATPGAILRGPLERRLIDFFELALGPAGRVHVAFAEDLDGDGAPRSWYVASRTSLFGRREDRR